MDNSEMFKNYKCIEKTICTNVLVCIYIWHHHDHSSDNQPAAVLHILKIELFVKN